jgi:DNA-binding transcriptional MerR regulator
MDERLIVRPRILDHKRMYSRRDVARLALITALRNKGQSLQEARMAALELHDQITTGDVIVKVRTAGACSAIRMPRLARLLLPPARSSW